MKIAKKSITYLSSCRSSLVFKPSALGMALAILFVMPKFLTQQLHRMHRKYLQKKWIPWSLAFLVVAVAVVVTVIAEQRSGENQEKFLREEKAAVKELLVNRLDSYEKVLQGLRPFIKDGKVDQAAWNAYTHSLSLSDHFPGFQAVGFLNKNFSIGYAELVKKSGAPAYNVGSNPTLKAAAELSGNTGTEAHSGKVEWGKSGARQSGFYQFIPIYDPAADGGRFKTVAERRQHLQGWIYGIFSTSDLVQDIAKAEKGKVAFDIFDGVGRENGDLLFDGFTEVTEKGEDSIVKLDNHLWTVSFYTPWIVGGTFSVLRPYVILLGGFLLAGLCFFLARRLVAKHDGAVTTLNSILRHSEDAIISESSDGIILLWSVGAEKMYGYSAFEAVGKKSIFIVPQDRHHEVARTSRKIVHGMVDHYETKRISKDGKIIDIVLTSTPFLNFSGRIIGVLTFAREITNQKMNASWEQLFTSAIHDLQTPLHKILAFSERLSTKSDALDQSGHEYLERVQRATVNMQKMMEELVSLSQVLKEQVVFEPLPLKDVVKGVIADLEVRIAKVKGQIEIGSLPVIKGNENQMRLLFHCLISNVLQSASKGQNPKIAIHSRPAAEEGSVEIVFEEDGIDFDEKYIEEIFHPFSTFHTAEKTARIGLAVCEKIIMRHGGRIHVRNRPNKGASFIITLPTA